MIRNVFEVLRWEIRRVRDGTEVRNEGSIDISDRVPVYSIEEWMRPDLVNSVARVLRGDEPGGGKIRQARGPSICIILRLSPSDHVLRLTAEVDIIGEVQMVLPVDDLLVRLMSILRAEWWIAHEAFEHDCT